MSDLNTLVNSVINKTVGSIPIRVQHKRMTKSQWENNNIILLDGEIGIESDTGYIKVGNGYSRFSDLSYSAPTNTGATTNGVSIQSSTVEYASHTSGTQAPNSGWVTSIPTVAAGQFLWSRLTINYTNGSNTTMYSAARQGDDGQNGTGSTTTTNGYIMLNHTREETQSSINEYTPGTLRIFYLHSNSVDFQEGDTVVIPIRNTTNNSDGIVIVKVTDKYGIGYLRGTIVNYYGESTSTTGGTQNAVVRFEDLTPAQIQQLKGEKGDPGQNGTSVTAQIKTKSQYDSMSYKDPNVIYIIKEG